MKDFAFFLKEYPIQFSAQKTGTRTITFSSNLGEYTTEQNVWEVTLSYSGHGTSITIPWYTSDQQNHLTLREVLNTFYDDCSSVVVYGKHGYEDWKSDLDFHDDNYAKHVWDASWEEYEQLQTLLTLALDAFFKYGWI